MHSKAEGPAEAASVFPGTGLSGRGEDRQETAALTLREPGTTTPSAAACRDRSGGDIREMAGGDSRQGWRFSPPGSLWRPLEQGPGAAANRLGALSRSANAQNSFMGESPIE